MAYISAIKYKSSASAVKGKHYQVQVQLIAGAVKSSAVCKYKSSVVVQV